MRVKKIYFFILFYCLTLTALAETSKQDQFVSLLSELKANIETSLYQAKDYELYLRLDQTFKSSGIDLNAKTNGVSLLAHFSNRVENDSLEVLEYLLMLGADPDQALLDEKPLINHAIEKQDFALTHLLMNYGANLKCPEPSCEVAYQKSIRSRPQELKLIESQAILTLSDRKKMRLNAQKHSLSIYEQNHRKIETLRLRNSKVTDNSKPLDYDPQAATTLTQPLLFVTHASYQFRGAYRVIDPIDEAISWAKQKKMETAFLMIDMISAESFDHQWITADPIANYYAYSTAGEHFFKIKTYDITFVGGYFGACYSNTIAYTLRSFFENNPASSKPLRLTLVTKASYSSNYSSLFELMNRSASDSKDRNTRIQKFFELDLSNRTPDLFEKATVSFYLDNISIGTQGNGPQQIEFRIQTQLP